MKVLVLNVGSTTLKYAVVETASGKRLDDGVFERIGEPEGDAADHLSAAGAVLDRSEAFEVEAIGHRIVHGGSAFDAPVLVDDQVLGRLAELDVLAPLHNPPGRTVLEELTRRDLGLQQVLVFDTSYFAKLPAAASRYAIPEKYFTEYGIRRYGAHGISHRYVTERILPRLTGESTEKRIISLHLGGGASATASKGGVAVETSMGLTPLEGLVMTTRSGDIDPAVVYYLNRAAGMSVEQVDHVLNEESGVLGLCGKRDMRNILQQAADGDTSAELAIDVYVHRIQKYIGSYIAILGGLDALIFTAGVGENAAEIRQRVTQPLAHLGVAIDPQRTGVEQADEDVVELTGEGAAVRTFIVATDEERAIADHVAALIGE